MTTNPTERRAALGTGGWLVAPGFLLLAVWFLWGPDVVEIPVSPVHEVNRALLDTGGRRKVLGDPPRLVINGFERTCMDCHRMFQSEQPKNEGRLQHQDVVLEHGPNRNCYRCHDEHDRDRLVELDGQTIGYSQVVQLCGQCHGSIFRDWQHGMHGRTNGYWDPTRGERRRLRCTQCHDPHRPRSPAMDPLQPLPGPHTLRMGEQPAELPPDHELADPLQRAIEGIRSRREGTDGAGEHR